MGAGGGDRAGWRWQLRKGALGGLGGMGKGQPIELVGEGSARRGVREGAEDQGEAGRE